MARFIRTRRYFPLSAIDSLARQPKECRACSVEVERQRVKLRVISEEEALHLMAVPKRLPAGLECKPRLNHAGHQALSCQFEDEDGALIPGLTLVIEIKAPIVVDRCLYLFTMLSFQRGARHRAYQLEVAPQTRKTHNSPTETLYGPHEHIGTECVRPVQDVCCGEFEGAFVFFAQKCAIALPHNLPPLVLS